MVKNSLEKNLTTLYHYATVCSMDTSLEYIKMCEKAEEIQEQWYPKCGDYVRLSNKDARVTIIVDSPTWNVNDGRPDRFLTVAFPWSYGVNTDYKKIHEMIWLPRQDQLQGIIGWRNDPYCGAMLSKFMRWYNENQIALPSMEQLWLSFVMLENHKKVLDGEQWTYLRK